ncbi:hypothetical protein M422DRAFT_48358 [Sphaerobolus stellatus SS14]|uniref:6-phosphogluconolactonase n=1 Tax=Sphaerobolus stellatus (strain SS14) TaxID=990650 RepID=A0A0C9VKE5_SPHS4|nr:hypothetical protein M422DRAFT_48358 [Sphaerobolus stellatus SS14]
MVQANFTLIAGNFATILAQYAFTSSLTPGARGSLSLTKTFPGGINPSWVGLNRNNNSVLCATQEVFEGGAVTFVMDRSQGDDDLTLQVISNQSVQGNGPPFCDFTDDNSIALFPVFGGEQLTFFDSLDGATLTDRQIIPFNTSIASTQVSKPHQAVEVNGQIFVPDLGADKVWRLNRTEDGLVIAGAIDQKSGSGPRHIVVADDCLVTIHELDNTITTQRIPPNDQEDASVITSLTTPPEGSDLSQFAAAEVKFIPKNDQFARDIIFASNRQLPGNSSAQGDTIVSYAFDSQACTLKQLVQNPTGLTNLRTMEVDPTGRFIITAAFAEGGVKVFERTGCNGAKLVEVASNTELTNATSFVWLPQLD